jgi:L-lactate dehydrogenase complex protein LldG
VNGKEFLDGVAARLGRSRERLVARPPVNKPGQRAQALDPESRIQTFKVELERVGGRVLVLESLPALGRQLQLELEAARVRSLVSFARSERAAWQLDAALAGRQWHSCPEQADDSARARFRETALEADAGLTVVDYALVETGSLVISCGPTRPRSVSLLPRLHLALVREAQLVDSMGAALRSAMAQRVPSALQIVTGPSRTSDIENDLTIGVHGPAAVCVLLLKEPRGSREAA